MDYAIFIPARNVGKTLENVLERIPSDVRLKAREIIIIDNDSSDETSEIVKKLASLYSITYFRNEKNLGYGGSQKKAFQYCLEKKYNAVVIVHGDAQYAPEFTGELVSELYRSGSAMCFGSRMAGAPLAGGMPLYRYIANIFLTSAGNFFLGTQLSEFHSGFRAFQLAHLAEADFHSCSDDFHFDTEIIVRLVEKNFSIAEITIPTHYGKESSSISFMHSLWYGLNVLRAVIFFRSKKIVALKR
ncbi:MAG: glycosyltransferase family 2 protein [Bacteriovoracaceae bacterium]